MQTGVNGGNTAVPRSCLNPFCNNPLNSRKEQHACSDRCRLTVWALRKAAGLLLPLGKEQAWALLKELAPKEKPWAEAEGR